MYQVVASDLDGTLLSPDHTLSPYAKETLKLLTAHGINFVFATGRHHVDVGQIRDNLEIKSYMITSNGARVHDLDGNLIFAHNLDRDIASDLFGVVNDNPDIITNVYRDDEWFMNRHRPEATTPRNTRMPHCNVVCGIFCVFPSKNHAITATRNAPR